MKDALPIVGALVILGLLAWPLGLYMADVFQGKPTRLGRVIRPIEKLVYRLIGVDEKREQSWVTYGISLLAFNALGMLLVYTVLRTQAWLPLNPENRGNVSPWLAFNTAISFGTNTNWQAYSGESTLSYASQMVALTVQNFVSAATGISVILAVARGFSRASARTIGNFWVDMVRSVLYVLLPLSIVGGIALVATGVPQTLGGSVDVPGIAGASQILSRGPAASQIIIKQLGTNGGGFFGANSAHPFENPSAISNLIEMISLLLIPVGLVVTFGKLVGNIRQGLALGAAMTALLVVGLVVTTTAERAGNPGVEAFGVTSEATVNGEPAPGGNMEGKEVRFGIPGSTNWAVFTTAVSNGAVNGMMDSYTPLGSAVPILNMATGEVIFGGVGSGLYGMLFYAIAALFIAGLMVGRTPEYIGKKIDAFDIKMAMMALLICPLLILGLTALATIVPDALASRTNGGPHGLSQIIYAFTSAAGNNGSAFAGLAVNTDFYNIFTGAAMFFGRFLVIIPALAIAGSLASKRQTAVTAGTLPTTGAMWVGLLVGTVVIVGALTYFPILALGPVAEHLFMHDGVLFGLD